MLGGESTSAPILKGSIANLRQPSTGLTLSCFGPSNPPTVLTPDRQLASCKATNVTLLFAVPTFMEVSQPTHVGPA